MLSTMGREAETLTIINSLFQLVYFPARIPDRIGDRRPTLGLTLIFVLPPFSNITSLSLLGSWSHCLISFLNSFPRRIPVPNSGYTLRHYNPGNEDGFREFPVCYSWKGSCLSSSTFLPVSNLTDPVLQDLHIYIPYFSKPSKPWSPEWHCSPNRVSRNRFVQARNRCPLTVQKAKDCLVCHKAELLASSATGNRSFWSMHRRYRNFCFSKFPPIISLCSVTCLTRPEFLVPSLSQTVPSSC